MNSLIIGVDFDGTIVPAGAWPGLEGVPPLPGAVQVLHALMEAGHRLILWTIRDGAGLQGAVTYTENFGVRWWGVNENPAQADPHAGWSASPKAHCDVFIDDKALGAPLDANGDVDWVAAEGLLHQAGVLAALPGHEGGR